MQETSCEKAMEAKTGKLKFASNIYKSFISEDFNAEKFVQYLLEEGTKRPCDETIEAFNQNGKLPSFYDEALYKK